MKKLMLFFIPLFFLECADKGELYKTLVLKKQFCEIESEGMVYIPEIILKNNDYKIGSYTPELLNNYIVIDSLDSNKCIIEYRTIFNQIQTLSIDLGNKLTDTISLCIDKINYADINHITFIDKLKEGNHFTINVWTQGCVSYGSSEMKIKKLDGDIFVEYKNQEKKLSLSEIELIKRFELELVKIDYGNCSNTDKYTLKYNDEILKIDDRSCTWFGYSNLINRLFEE